jgi:hypothetical protein
MKKKCIVSILAGTVIGLTTLFTSCDKEPTEVGVGLQPGSDKIIIATDTLELITKTVRDSSIASDERSVSLLGSYQDSQFGLTNASFITHIRLSSSNVNDEVEIIPDSMELVLDYNGYYGDTTENIQFKLYQIKESSFDIDSTYYSDYQVNSDPLNLELIGEYTFQPHISDTLVRFSISDADFINQFSNTDIYLDNETLLEAFHGLYLETIETTTEGCISYFDLTSESSNLVMYYNDTLTYNFNINSYCARINLFSHDYSTASAELTSVLNNPTENEEFSFLQSAAGLNVEIRIKDTAKLNSLLSKGINKAELEITIASEFSNGENLADQLVIVYQNEEGLYEFLTDYKVSSDHFGGILDEDLQTYTFHIPLYVQDLLQGTVLVENNLSLFPLNNRSSVSQCAIYGGNHSEKPMQIKIVASEY